MELSRRTGLSILLFALFAGVNLLSLACSIKKPQAPSWYTDWSLPLINRQIGMTEIMERFDDSNVYYDSAGNPGINITQPIDTVLIDDQLTIESAQLQMRDSLGAVEIESPDAVQCNTPINRIINPSLGYVPPASFAFSENMEPLDRFDWAIIDRGSLQIAVFNALEVDLDTLIVTIIDAGDSHIIGIAAFENGVNYLESDTEAVDISGQRISNTISLSYHGHTPGGVLVNVGGQYIRAAMNFSSNLTVSAARAEIPQITRTKRDSYEIEDSTEVQTAIVSSGQLNFDVLNDTELPCFITVRSHNFRLSGSDFTLSGQLPPHAHRIFNIDITGYSFIPQVAQSPLQVLVEMTNSISASAPQRYTFRALDSISLHLEVSQITFQSLTGRIKPTPVDIHPVTRVMELPDGIDQSRLTHGSLFVAVANNSLVPASLNLDITGGGNLIILSGVIAPKPAVDSPPATTIISATPEQTLQFLDPPPDQVIISGTGIINPDYQQASLSRGDYFRGELTISSPLAIAIDDTISFTPEVLDISIDESRPDDIGERIFSGDIRAVLENRLPLGARISLVIGNRSDTTLYTDTSSLILGPYSIGAASVGPSGSASSPTTSMISDIVDNSHLWLFDGDSIFIGQVIELFPTDTSGIIINGADYLKVRANAAMNIRIGD